MKEMAKIPIFRAKFNATNDVKLSVTRITPLVRQGALELVWDQPQASNLGTTLGSTLGSTPGSTSGSTKWAHPSKILPLLNLAPLPLAYNGD